MQLVKLPEISQKADLRYHDIEAKRGFVFATMTLTFDFRPPKTNVFIFKSRWTFVQNSKKFSQAVPEM